MATIQLIEKNENKTIEAKCLLLDSAHNQEEEGLGMFLKQEFGRKLTEVISFISHNYVLQKFIHSDKKQFELIFELKFSCRQPQSDSGNIVEDHNILIVSQ